MIVSSFCKMIRDGAVAVVGVDDKTDIICHSFSLSLQCPACFSLFMVFPHCAVAGFRPNYDSEEEEYILAW